MVISEVHMKRKMRKLKKQFLFLILILIILGGSFAFIKTNKKEETEKELPNITYKEVLTTNVGEEINLLENVSGLENLDVEITVEGDYDFNKEGEYSLFYVLKDKNGNSKKEPFTLKVIKVEVKIEEPKPNESNHTSNEKSFTTSKGFHGEVKNGVTYIEGTLIVNKTYSLPSTYGNGLTKETKEAFSKLQAAALLDGFNIYIASGFRSYQKQVTLYNNYVKRDGKAGADTYSARPGHSEHQSGFTFDVNEVSDKFHGTPEANWLSDNCYKYGFILRFPNGKANETGFKYESWHFRYVGKELAEKLYNNGDWLTLEGYFGITSEYQN